MDSENMAMGIKAFSNGDKMLRLMKELRTGIKELARHFGVYE